MPFYLNDDSHSPPKAIWDSFLQPLERGTKCVSLTVESHRTSYDKKVTNGRSSAKVISMTCRRKSRSDLSLCKPSTSTEPAEHSPTS